MYSSPDATPSSLVRAKQLHGKELSYNNLLDLDNALADCPVAAGAGRRGAQAQQPVRRRNGRDAGRSDRAGLGGRSGECVWLGAGLQRAGRRRERRIPGRAGPVRRGDRRARRSRPRRSKILTTKPKWKANVRLLAVGAIEPRPGRAASCGRSRGGMLCQTADDLPDDEAELASRHRRTAHRRHQMADLRFAWAVCRHVKSNAIALAKERTLLGVGAGQMSRVDSVEIAISKAGERVGGSVLASDAFFPFEDSIHRAAAAGDCGRHPAGRLPPRRGGDRRLQPARPGDGLYRHAAFPALREVVSKPRGTVRNVSELARKMGLSRSPPRFLKLHPRIGFTSSRMEIGREAAHNDSRGRLQGIATKCTEPRSQEQECRSEFSLTPGS